MCVYFESTINEISSFIPFFSHMYSSLLHSSSSLVATSAALCRMFGPTWPGSVNSNCSAYRLKYPVGFEGYVRVVRMYGEVVVYVEKNMKLISDYSQNITYVKKTIQECQTV